MDRPSIETRWELMRRVAAAAGEPGQPAALFEAIDAALGEVAGHKLFTLMILHRETGEAERVYTSNPADYPVAGRKQMTETPWYRHAIVGRQHYFGPTRADIRWAFFDHELIEQLGCGAVINLLVTYDDQILGTANLLHAEHHYHASDIEACHPFAQLLAPAFLALADR